MNVPDLDPTSECALRAAFHALGLRRSFTFEQAMSNPALAIGIKNVAEIHVRRITRS